MNFLKSVLSSSPLPGYAIQDKIDLPNCIYSLHNGLKKDDGTPCSILVFEKTSYNTPLAKNFFAKLRLLKHPSIVKFLDSIESDTHIYIATERIAPLSHVLSKSLERDQINWGLYSIAQAIAFINGEAYIHGNIRISSIFTTESGDWKLSGFDIATCMKEDEHIMRYGSSVPDIQTILPAGFQFSSLTDAPTASLDAYEFGALISMCYNGHIGTQQGKIPGNMLAQHRRLMSANAQTRLPVSSFIDFGRRPSLFFQNDLIVMTEKVAGLSLAPKEEIDAFLQNKAWTKLPSGYIRNKLLPEMVRILEQGGGAPALEAILLVAKDLSPADIETLITPMILRIWTTKARSTHLVLLEQLNEYIDYLTPKQINDKLFPAVATVFSDQAPIMRETAIRQILTLIPHLSDRNINGELLKCLARTANDQQPGIRTNTTICLGKIAKHLGGGSKRKVLTAAFSRSLKDPFVHARTAALQAISATSEVYEKDDLALRLMPGIVCLLIDEEESIRTHSKACLLELLDRIDVLTKGMSEQQGQSKAVVDVESGGRWAGWAVLQLPRTIDVSSRASTPINNTAASSPQLESSSTDPVSTAATKPIVTNQSHSSINRSSNGKKTPGKGLVLQKKETSKHEWTDWNDESGGPTPIQGKVKSGFGSVSSSTVATPVIEEAEWDTDAW